MNARSSQTLTALPLIAAAALVAVPVAAQQVAPPPVTATQAPPVASVAPPSVVVTVRERVTDNATGSATTVPVDPTAAAAAAAERTERRPAARTPRPASRATAPVRQTAPVAARAPAAPAAPVQPTPEAAPRAATATIPPTVPATPTAPAAPAAASAPEAPAAQRDGSIWPWIVAALAVVGVAAALLLWRRRRAREGAFEETAYTTEPVDYQPTAAPAPEPAPVTQPAAAPVAVAPAAAAAPAMLDRAPVADSPVATVEEASVAEADAGDIEVLTAGAPVGDRPWLELAVRPVRAGTTDDDARVEIELTVGNAGPVDAEEVHVSTFMLADADDGEIERMLVDPPIADAVEPLRIGAGQGARVDAALTLPRSALATEARFRPVVIAAARYRLPGGGEGRTAASFDIGVSGDPDAPLAPVTTAGTEMRDDVEARLHRMAEHA